MEINVNIIDLWSKYQTKMDLSRSPLLYNDFNRNSLLFVGLNPSFNVPKLNEMLMKTKCSNTDINEIMAFSNINKYIDIILELEADARENYPYFNKFKEISKEIKINWEHIDIYLERETNQDIIIEKYKNHKDFVNKQFNLFIKLIDEIRPLIIVVVNAYASKLFQRKFKQQLSSFSQEIGTYYFTNKNLRIPIFFSGMLTGQRALDIGSYNRLKWHIKYVLEKNNLT